MPFPLINPKITFTDLNGVPMVGGTVEFRDPATDLPVSTYPTANDATGLTPSGHVAFAAASEFVALTWRPRCPYATATTR